MLLFSKIFIVKDSGQNVQHQKWTSLNEMYHQNVFPGSIHFLAPNFGCWEVIYRSGSTSFALMIEPRKWLSNIKPTEPTDRSRSPVRGRKWLWGGGVFLLRLSPFLFSLYFVCQMRKIQMENSVRRGSALTILSLGHWCGARASFHLFQVELKETFILSACTHRRSTFSSFSFLTFDTILKWFSLKGVEGSFLFFFFF